MYSLKRKLRRNLLITVAGAMAVLLTVLHLGIRQLTEDYVTSRLGHDADSLIAALVQDPDGQWRLQDERMSTVYQRVRSGHYYLVTVNQQLIRSRSLFDLEVKVPEFKLGQSRCSVVDYSASERWLACAQTIAKQGDRITIWVAEDIIPLQHEQREFMLFALVSVMTAILILLIAQYQILQRGFSQLERTREFIRQMHRGEKGIALQELPTEIQPLVDEINRLVEQLGERVKRSRTALGNLAHALKRPLQQLRSQLETQDCVQRRPGEEILQEIQSVLDRELKRARIVGVTTPGRRIQLDQDLPHLLKALRSIYPDKQIVTDCPADLVLPHDRDDLLELLGNLLDNACKFARSQVQLRFELFDQGWRILVEDDGAGVSPEALKIIAERGVRLDESVQGHGLGLSICRDIVTSYHGTISFDPADLGGLKVTVFLPEPLSEALEQ